MDKKTGQIICTSFANGKCHDFRLFKESKVRIATNTLLKTDTGYQGVKKLHSNSELPIKRRRKQKLTKEEKRYNRQVSSDRVLNENVIGFIKRFKIVSDKYLNRRKRFGLRFNLIAGICNYDVRI